MTILYLPLFLIRLALSYIFNISIKILSREEKRNRGETATRKKVKGNDRTQYVCV